MNSNIEIRSDAVYPLSVSYHGTSTILVGADKRWASQQIDRRDAEKICTELNAAKANPVCDCGRPGQWHGDRYAYRFFGCAECWQALRGREISRVSMRDLAEITPN